MVIFISRSLKRKLDQENDESTSSKEIKKAARFEETSGMGIFNNLCQEMFEEIVSYLRINDILKLCLASSSMNEFISNNDLVMRRITLKFPKIDQLSVIDESQRIYRKVAFIHQITISQFPTVLPYIEKIALHAKDIKLVKEQSIHVAVNIIKQFTSATKIYAKFKTTRSRLVKPRRALKIPNLKDLEVNGTSKTFGLFEKCQLLEKLKLTNFECAHEYTLRLQQFMIKQTKLKSLNIRFSHYMFEKNILTNSQFKLKEFVTPLYYPYLTAEGQGNFQNFLNLHLNTLERSSVQDTSILEFVRGFPKLTTIELGPFQYTVMPPVLEEMPLVENLKINGSHYVDSLYSPDAFDVYTHLKEFRGNKLSWDSSFNHGSIEKLFLDSCRFSNINMQNLKSALFKNIVFSSEIQLNDNIQELSLDGCKNAENLLSFVERPEVNLKLLEISNMNLSNRQVITANKHKIQRLIYKNVTRHA